MGTASARGAQKSPLGKASDLLGLPPSLQRGSAMEGTGLQQPLRWLRFTSRPPDVKAPTPLASMMALPSLTSFGPFRIAKPKAHLPRSLGALGRGAWEILYLLIRL